MHLKSLLICVFVVGGLLRGEQWPVGAVGRGARWPTPLRCSCAMWSGLGSCPGPRLHPAPPKGLYGSVYYIAKQ